VTFKHINELIKANKIKPIIGKMYNLSDAAKAHHDIIHNEGSSGRITLKIN
jgi:NADPH:quinone reductase-like Zn-dependent oxidoreductase